MSGYVSGMNRLLMEPVAAAPQAGRFPCPCLDFKIDEMACERRRSDFVASGHTRRHLCSGSAPLPETGAPCPHWPNTESTAPTPDAAEEDGEDDEDPKDEPTPRRMTMSEKSGDRSAAAQDVSAHTPKTTLHKWGDRPVPDGAYVSPSGKVWNRKGGTTQIAPCTSCDGWATIRDGITRRPCADCSPSQGGRKAPRGHARGKSVPSSNGERPARARGCSSEKGTLRPPLAGTANAPAIPVRGRASEDPVPAFIEALGFCWHLGQVIAAIAEAQGAPSTGMALLALDRAIAHAERKKRLLSCAAAGS